MNSDMTVAQRSSVSSINSPGNSNDSVIKIAVMAVGGQGGGTLTGWIANLATLGGYAVQMTSVAGVAQRTGATIYYVEMAPRTTHAPVFALSPSPGDIDILIASELMEAGRAILRGFVTENKTTLIASTHRVLAISEKEVPGDGRAQAAVVTERLESSALRSVCFDMQTIADEAGTMISASLFGALARSGALPFEQALFEEVIQNSGRGVEKNMAAFHGAIAYDTENCAMDATITGAARHKSQPTGPEDKLQKWQSLSARVDSLPAQIQDMAHAGLVKTVDYQDLDYGHEYLDLLASITAIDTAQQAYRLSLAAAKYVANAMCYDDILRVADLKTRSSRDIRVRREQQVGDDQIVHVTEYFHPRAEEFCATLPASLGARIESSPRLFSIVQKLMSKGRRIRTDKMPGFCALWLVAGMRPYRRKLLRHRYESRHLARLIADTRTALAADYDLAVEILHCQRLIKGYSDTHLRGQSKYQLVTGAALATAILPGTAAQVKSLREIALKDEHGDELAALLESPDL